MAEQKTYTVTVCPQCGEQLDPMEDSLEFYPCSVHGQTDAIVLNVVGNFEPVDVEPLKRQVGYPPFDPPIWKIKR